MIMKKENHDKAARRKVYMAAKEKELNEAAAQSSQ